MTSVWKGCFSEDSAFGEATHSVLCLFCSLLFLVLPPGMGEAGGGCQGDLGLLCLAALMTIGSPDSHRNHLERKTGLLSWVGSRDWGAVPSGQPWTKKAHTDSDYQEKGRATGRCFPGSSGDPSSLSPVLHPFMEPLVFIRSV